jgi:hypothetical protein
MMPMLIVKGIITIADGRIITPVVLMISSIRKSEKTLAVETEREDNENRDR